MLHYLRFPTQQRPSLRDVWMALPGIVLRMWLEADIALRIRNSRHLFDALKDRPLYRIAAIRWQVQHLMQYFSKYIKPVTIDHGGLQSRAEPPCALA